MKKLNGSKITDFFKRYWMGVVIIILVVAVMASSVEIYREEVLNIDPTIEYIEQKTLFLSAEEIDTLNPVISGSEDTYYLSKLIYSSLFNFDENLNVVPELVSEYEINTEKAYIDITLKKGVKWHNGKTLTANDVAFTVSAMRAAGSACPYYNKIKKINSAFTRGNNKLSVYFNNNYNCSLDDLVFPIVPSSQYNGAAAFASADEGFKPVGTGQYKYKSFNKKKQLRLVPNDDFFGDKAEKNISVTMLPERELSSNMMEIDSVSCYVDSSANRKATALDRGYRIFDFVSNNVEFLVFNTVNQYLKQKDMRKALAYGIDTNKILDSAYMGDGILTDTVYYPNFLGVKDTLSEYNYDIKKAEEMLAGLGWKDIDKDGVLEDTNGKDYTFRILVNKNNATRGSAALLIKKNLELLGIKTEIISLPKTEYMNSIKRRDFDILITGYTVDENYDLRELFNGKNQWGYNNYNLFMKARELDRLYTPKQYAQKYEKLKEQLLEELPYYPLCYKKMSLIRVNTFKAQGMPMFNNIYRNCYTWNWSVVSEKNNEKKD